MRRGEALVGRDVPAPRSFANPLQVQRPSRIAVDGTNPTCTTAAVARIERSYRCERAERAGIDYDRQKDEWRAFGADQQGTPIAFHGARETGRIRFMTKARIAALVASTVR